MRTSRKEPRPVPLSPFVDCHSKPLKTRFGGGLQKAAIDGRSNELFFIDNCHKRVQCRDPSKEQHIVSLPQIGIMHSSLARRVPDVLRHGVPLHGVLRHGVLRSIAHRQAPSAFGTVASSALIGGVVGGAVGLGLHLHPFKSRPHFDSDSSNVLVALAKTDPSQFKSVVVTLVAKLNDASDADKAAWAIGEIAWDDNDDEIGKAGALPKLVRMLDSPKSQHVVQATYALYRVAWKGKCHAKEIRELGAIPKLVAQLDTHWLKAPLDAYFALKTLAEKDPECRNAIVPALVDLLRKASILHPVAGKWIVKVMEEVADSGAEGASVVVRAGAIPLIVHLLGDSDVREEAADTLRALAKRDKSACRAIREAGAIPRLLSMVDRTTWMSWRKAWYAGNALEALAYAEPESLEQIVPALVERLDSFWEKTKNQSLRTLRELAQDSSECRRVMVESGVIPRAVELAKSPKRSLSDEASPLLKALAKSNNDVKADISTRLGGAPLL